MRLRRPQPADEVQVVVRRRTRRPRQHTIANRQRKPTTGWRRIARPHVDTSKERRGNADDLNVNPSDAQ